MAVQGRHGDQYAIMHRLTVAFRVDASLQIGTGHVMRCLTLADALRKQQVHCMFICREHPGHLLLQVQEHGFELHVLPAPVATDNDTAMETLPHSAWLGVDIETDAHETLAAIGPLPVDWLVVDHYALDVHWEKQLQSAYHRLMVIDDLADRSHDCDMLLDQNLGRTTAEYVHLTPKDCCLLLEPGYALLRPEFARMRSESLARREHPRLQSLLVTMGGVDKDNATGQVLSALEKTALANEIEIKVIMGANAPWLNVIQQQAQFMRWPTTVLTDVHNMAEQITAADMVIGAAGGTSWERCCLGVPSLIVVLAENQRRIATALEASGAALCLGETHQKNFDVRFVDAMHRLTKVPNALMEMSVNARAITLGDGTQRTIEKMQLQLRT